MRSKRVLAVAALLVAAGAPAGAGELQPAGVARPVQAGPLTLYQLPGPNPGPWGVALDGQQRVWVTLDKVNQLGRLDPATGTWQVLPLPAGFRPFLAASAGPALWVTDYDLEARDRPGRLLRVDGDTGAATVFPVTGAAPAKVLPAGDTLWFTDLNGGKAGALALPAGASAGPLAPRLLLPTPPGAKRPRTPYPYGLALDARGRLWYAEAGNGRVVRVAGSQQEAFPVPDTFWAPSDLGVDPQGRIWVAGHATSALLVLDAEGGQVLREVRLRAPGPAEESPVARPNGVLPVPDGLWVAEHEGGRITRVLYDSFTVVEYPLPGKKTWPQWLAPAPGGGVWFAAYGSGQIGRVAADAPAFHVRVSLPPEPVRRGASVRGTMEVAAAGPGSGELTLELPDLPHGVTGQVEPPVVRVAPGQPARAHLTLQVGAGAELGPNWILAGGHMPGVLVTGAAPLQVAPALLGIPGLQPGHLAALAAAVAAGAGALARMRKRRRAP